MTKQALYLYRLTVELTVGNELDIIVIAPSDELAFAYAEQELERSWLPMPEVREWFIEEKKRVRRGAGYVVGLGHSS